MSDHSGGTLTVDRCGPVMVVTIDGGEHQLFGLELANQLDVLVERADADPSIHAMILTGNHPTRFASHADVFWLQSEGAATPKLSPTVASALMRTARHADRGRLLEGVVSRTPIWGAVQLDRLHATFLKMNSSGVVVVAALNGSALGLGAELAWACDLRVMVDDDSVIGQPEVLLGFPPGGGGTQRLARLIGQHRALTAIMEGKPFTPATALEVGAVDAVVPREQLMDKALELAQHFGARSKEAIGAIKRSVYLGGSMPIEDGLAKENAEFISLMPSARAQELMLDYMASTEALGELPLYDSEVYAQALAAGYVPKQRAERDR
ncbi:MULTISPECIES: enoyl-CoA hydratase/isomerase family protein [Nocardiaceae]|uniref:Enoyl-CoA hydratase/isomerase family protein n=1 Tax=Rhodococcoides kroppenstedtii TaxID=293050 RepID=A0ABS7NXL0_9NOCA|nr:MULTISPECIES: enoyl-CoA hydratase/isomerase family protein [Rhodococcus]AMY20301.1 Fatty acid oxidation complex subunit alpha [Rhodococcus sp. PBTS 1]MBY6314950.1 enoyl-CoA hydratase/isomerase family protein [Rhodococcus kroppenstedtii]MBY6322686.1 enoyl-CoA hydratase/isomerase family protein [Rhodococcus kroppenstedtii]MBY6399986.1 enoyl-CoA hydratase/isomerase family protein [Rhodococcus kroppenstedtii]MBY6438072.1 enoyl-CoA hydratase/isomerase family protein [Rhodococcus kroppenstedtii]